MPEMIRVKINWTGFVGGPGYTNLHFEPTVDGPITQEVVDAAVAKVDTFLVELRYSTPVAVTTRVDPIVQEVNELNGDLEDFYTATTAAAAPGMSTAGYSSASGACINWYTNEVKNGRRVRGRTFLVPLGSDQYDTTGTLTTSFLTGMNAAAALLSDDTDAARLVVWHRNPVGQIIPEGGAYAVSAWTLADKVAMLTSRRD